ncbi:MAG: DUF4230 domain-containing protein [Lachnospiraceae bacterium]|nr:DUF4230 domain-containing protein [Lachnospiraceae bacterium]
MRKECDFMKRSKIFVPVLLLSALLLCSCGKEKVKPKEPELSVVRNICELSTLKCRYNNLAKSKKEKGSGPLHWFEKERKFWIEYTGEVEIGIDMSKVTMDVNAKKARVTVSMPKAKLISIKADENTLNEDSYVFSKDAFFNKNEITARDQQKAMKKAQESMKKKVEGDEALFLQAEGNAKKLIENYIEQMGKVSGVEYKVVWKVRL